MSIIHVNGSLSAVSLGSFSIDVLYLMLPLSLLRMAMLCILYTMIPNSQYHFLLFCIRFLDILFFFLNCAY